MWRQGFRDLQHTFRNQIPINSIPQAERLSHPLKDMGRAKDWSSFLSEEANARQDSPLKALAKHLAIPGIISLGGGYTAKHYRKLTCRLPSPAYFPFEFADIRVPTVGRFDEADVVKSGTTLRIVKRKDNLTAPSGEEPLLAKHYPTDLAATLQYAQGYGDVFVREFMKEHIRVSHLLRLN